ncbi:MAG: hypothetical protein HOV79_21850 [Hamadaea sp.]|nr:hypothetical protein [Hamadaea sp.]
MPNPARMFGRIPGVEMRQEFPSRRTLYDAGVHRSLQAGIVGTGASGAESIVMSGGYDDDEDNGAMIRYTGHGGRNPNTGRQEADQKPDHPGNAALITSMNSGAPVRLIRGRALKSQFAPASANYRYDGLYQVTKHWRDLGKEQFTMCFFTLAFLDSGSKVQPIDEAAVAEIAQIPTGNLAPDKIAQLNLAVKRDGAVVRFVKAIHQHQCQVCGVRIMLRGRPYAEAAHIQPVGGRHKGPDVPTNVLCLCPNCHVQFDAGEIRIAADHSVTGGLVGSAMLRTVDGHPIDRVYLEYHDEVHFPPAT